MSGWIALAIGGLIGSYTGKTLYFPNLNRKPLIRIRGI